MSIGKATSVPYLYGLWKLIKEDGMNDRVSLRVFEGHLYSLMDDKEFYEGYGCRKLINLLTCQWDCIRSFALKDEKQLNWGSSKIGRTPEEQTRMNEMITCFDEWMMDLRERAGLYNPLHLENT